MKISLTDEVYEKLETIAREDESVGECVERLVRTASETHPLSDIVGILDDDDTDRVREGSERFRDKLDDGLSSR